MATVSFQPPGRGRRVDRVVEVLRVRPVDGHKGKVPEVRPVAGSVRDRHGEAPPPRPSRPPARGGGSRGTGSRSPPPCRAVRDRPGVRRCARSARCPILPRAGDRRARPRPSPRPFPPRPGSPRRGECSGGRGSRRTCPSRGRSGRPRPGGCRSMTSTTTPRCRGPGRAPGRAPRRDTRSSQATRSPCMSPRISRAGRNTSSPPSSRARNPYPSRWAITRPLTNLRAYTEPLPAGSSSDRGPNRLTELPPARRCAVES